MATSATNHGAVDVNLIRVRAFVVAAESVTGHGENFVLPPIAQRDYLMGGF